MAIPSSSCSLSDTKAYTRYKSWVGTDFENKAFLIWRQKCIDEGDPLPPIHLARVPRSSRTFIGWAQSGQIEQNLDISTFDPESLHDANIKHDEQGQDYVRFLSSTKETLLSYHGVWVVILPSEAKTHPIGSLGPTIKRMHTWKEKNDWGDRKPHVELIIPEILKRNDYDTQKFPDDILAKMQPYVNSDDLNVLGLTASDVCRIDYKFPDPEYVLKSNARIEEQNALQDIVKPRPWIARLLPKIIDFLNKTHEIAVCVRSSTASGKSAFMAVVAKKSIRNIGLFFVVTKTIEDATSFRDKYCDHGDMNLVHCVTEPGKIQQALKRLSRIALDEKRKIIVVICKKTLYNCIAIIKRIIEENFKEDGSISPVTIDECHENYNTFVMHKLLAAKGCKLINVSATIPTAWKFNVYKSGLFTEVNKVPRNARIYEDDNFVNQLGNCILHANPSSIRMIGFVPNESLDGAVIETANPVKTFKPNTNGDTFIRSQERIFQAVASNVLDVFNEAHIFTGVTVKESVDLGYSTRFCFRFIEPNHVEDHVEELMRYLCFESATRSALVHASSIDDVARIKKIIESFNLSHVHVYECHSKMGAKRSLQDRTKFMQHAEELLLDKKRHELVIIIGVDKLQSSANFPFLETVVLARNLSVSKKKNIEPYETLLQLSRQTRYHPLVATPEFLLMNTYQYRIGVQEFVSNHDPDYDITDIFCYTRVVRFSLDNMSAFVMNAIPSTQMKDKLLKHQFSGKNGRTMIMEEMTKVFVRKYSKKKPKRTETFNVKLPDDSVFTQYNAYDFMLDAKKHYRLKPNVIDHPHLIKAEWFLKEILAPRRLPDLKCPTKPANYEESLKLLPHHPIDGDILYDFYTKVIANKNASRKLRIKVLLHGQSYTFTVKKGLTCTLGKHKTVNLETTSNGIFMDSNLYDVYNEVHDKCKYESGNSLQSTVAKFIYFQLSHLPASGFDGDWLSKRLLDLQKFKTTKDDINRKLKGHALNASKQQTLDTFWTRSAKDDKDLLDDVKCDDSEDENSDDENSDDSNSDDDDDSDDDNSEN